MPLADLEGVYATTCEYTCTCVHVHMHVRVCNNICVHVCVHLSMITLHNQFTLCYGGPEDSLRKREGVELANYVYVGCQRKKVN